MEVGASPGRNISDKLFRMSEIRKSEISGGRIVQISVNPKGGAPKYKVASARLETNGVEGDRQNDRRFHGGPERAVCLYSWDLIRALQDEGHSIECGATGENLAISGVKWNEVVPGARLLLGEAVLIEIVSYTSPCYKIADAFKDGDFKRISQKLRPGWSRVYARVLQPGKVCEDDEVKLS